MRYLLIGNAPHCADAVAISAASAEVILQCNKCIYAELLRPVRANYVFITNTGRNAKEVNDIVERLLSLRKTPIFASSSTQIIIARNSTFYRLKRRFLKVQQYWDWPAFGIRKEWKVLSRIWPIQKTTFLSSARLERTLLKLGMTWGLMPSTGMIAYDWVRRRLQPRDCLFTAGFTHQGWYGHPWSLESQLIKPHRPAQT